MRVGVEPDAAFTLSDFDDHRRHAINTLRTNTNIRYSENLVCYGLRNEQNCRTLVRRFFVRGFSRKLFGRRLFLFVRRLFLFGRRFSGRTKIFQPQEDFFLFGYFYEHFLNLTDDIFCSCFFTNIRFVS